MKGQVEFDGFDEFEARLRRAGDKAAGPFFGALEDGAQNMENRAKRGIAKPPKTGRVYTHRLLTNKKTGGIFAAEKRVPHQASAEGEWPARDTGHLDGGIRHGVVSRTKLVLEIDLEAPAEYAEPLEFKPPNRGGRPFLSRAADEEAPAVVAEAERRMDAEGLP